MPDTERKTWPERIAAITLFVEELDRSKRFYHDTFGLPIHFEDEDSAIFDFGNILVNLLKKEAVPELITPAHMAAPDAGSRLLLTVRVEEIDKLCADLVARGVVLLNGPIDRPWGPRTASIEDPDGHVWEFAQ